MSAIQKLKYRAEIISILNKYNLSEEVSQNIFKKDVEELRNFCDKDFLAKILIDEIISGNKKYANFCSLILLNTLDKEPIQNRALKILKNKNIPDKKKSYLISILKQKEIFFDFQEIEKFIDNVDMAAAEGVKEFLHSALINPEAQIDLLDFYFDISGEEKISLLESLAEDDQTDEIINAFSLISFLELSLKEKNIILPQLLNTKSPYAIIGLNNLLNFEDIKQTAKNKIRKKIKELKFKNPKFKDNTFIQDTKPYKTYISFTDGLENFSVVFSRINKKSKIDTFFSTINIRYGIVSIVGFYKITKKSFEEILFRLFADSPPIEIQPSELVAFLDYYSKKNAKTNTILPYEYNVWIKLVDDIELCCEDLSEYINSKLTAKQLPISKYSYVLNSKIIESWFYTKNQDKKIDHIFNLLNKSNANSFKNLEKEILKFIDNKLLKDKIFIEIFKTRLLLQAYISKLAKFDVLSEYLYGICYNMPAIRLFLIYLLQKSLFEYLIDYTENKDNQNIFQKKQEIDLTAKEIKNIINSIEEKWKLKKE